MKKWIFILLMVPLLCGCSAGETFETVGDLYAEPVMQEQRDIFVAVPENAVAIQGDTGTIYLCDGYEVTVEILSAGNVSGTFQTLTGFGIDDLTVMETAASDTARYECVWASAGEDGDLVGRAVILDDGIHHYCVTVLADADAAYALQQTVEAILDSVQLG